MKLKLLKGLIRACICMLVCLGGMASLLVLFTLLAFRTKNTILLVAMSQLSATNPLERGLGFCIVGVIQNAAMIVGPIMLVCLVWKGNITDIGYTSLKKDGKELITGLVIGAGAMTCIMLLLVVSGSIKLREVSGENINAILLSLIGYIMVGIGEETFFRGGLMYALKETQKPVLILFIPAVLFGLMHLGNDGMTFLALLNLVLFGLFAGYCFFRSGSIWLPVGFHIAWNFLQGCIYDFHVSGVVNDSIMKFDVVKTSIFTGGNFGPEGGLFATISLVLVTVIAEIYYKKTKFSFE